MINDTDVDPRKIVDNILRRKLNVTITDGKIDTSFPSVFTKSVIRQ